MKGFLLIDKPTGRSSFDVVREVKRFFAEKKVGHSGTLDPLATGLLVLALGEGTKLLEYLIGCDKEYEVVASFGAKSDSYDGDGVLEKVSDKKIDQACIKKVIEGRFLGFIDQLPPKFSALKIKGKRACDLVREGKEVKMSPRQVRIDSFEMLDYRWPDVSFRVSCGSGTYIRSLVHDLGKEVGVGAYVKQLRRKRVGKFSLEEANDCLESAELLTLEDVARRCFKVFELDDFAIQKLKDGKTWLRQPLEAKLMAAFYQEKLIGILKNSPDGQGVKFEKLILD